jgi:hypothetical protein
MTENIAIQPATADVQARIRASFEHQGLSGRLPSDIEHGLVRIALGERRGQPTAWVRPRGRHCRDCRQRLGIRSPHDDAG